MNYCASDTSDADASVGSLENASALLDAASFGCPECQSTGRLVQRKTVFLMLKPETFDRVVEQEYHFCPEPRCRIVYFTGEREICFTTADLRVRVGGKEKDDPIPLCYCFGFDAQDVREEIARTGRCSLPQRISALIKQGMCACPERNPSGACCLGEVKKAMRHCMAEAREEKQPR